LTLKDFAVPFTSLRNSAKSLAQNHFAELNQHVLAFLYPISICRVTYGVLLEML
jgi:hypothetical protein